MRSRFSAYVLQLVPYIADTYYPAVQADEALVEITTFAGNARFVALQVLSSGDTPAVNLAQFPVLPPDILAIPSAIFSYVHFKVWFFIADKLHVLEEHSRFIRVNGLWRYVDGVLLPHAVVKAGRNELCPCGSGKKYKVCTVHWLNLQPAPLPPSA